MSADSPARPPTAANALKHGLRSKYIVLPEVESEEEYETYRAEMFEVLAPVGALEKELATMAVDARWRMRRAARAELDAIVAERTLGSSDDGGNFTRALIGVQNYFRAINAEDDDYEGPLVSKDGYDIALAQCPATPPPSLPSNIMLQKIIRYEKMYSRQFYQALHALQAVQDQRHGKKTHLIRFQWH